MIAPEMASDGSMTRLPSGVLSIVEKPKGKITKPTYGVGVIAEATFSVDGLGVDIEFTTGWKYDARYPKRNDGVSSTRDIVITSLTVRSDTAVTKEILDAIPAGKLLAAATHAAGVRAVHYPIGYDGPSVVHPAFNVAKSDQSQWELVGHIGDSGRSGLIKELTGQTEPFDRDAQLRRVASIVERSRPNQQTKDVAAALNVGERHARRLIGNARDAGYLPPLDPNDKRTRKAQK